MQLENVDFFARAVRQCTDLPHARRLYARIIHSGQHTNRYLANLITEMFGRCGALHDAHLVFSTIPDPNIFSWTILLNACSICSSITHAQRVFDQMPHKDQAAWNTILQAYARNGDLDAAKNIFHSMNTRNVISWTTMLAAHSQIRDEAEVFFARMPLRNRISWNAMLAAHAQCGDGAGSRRCFDAMPERDAISWDTLLMSSSGDSEEEEGEEIEIRGIFERMPQRSEISWTLMIGGLGRSRKCRAAREIFDRIPPECRCVISDTAMLEAYAASDRMEDAVRLFSDMRSRNEISWNTLIGGFPLDEARRLFLKMPAWTAVSWNILLQAAAAAGADGDETMRLFEGMPERTALSWTALVMTLARSGDAAAARRAFDRMPLQSRLTWISVLSAYSRGGWIDEARAMVAPLGEEGGWRWLIEGYSGLGQRGGVAMEEVWEMEVEGIGAGREMMWLILSSCSHSGDVEEGKRWFMEMAERGVKPRLKHYAGIVDGLARAGRVAEAEDLVENMPFVPNSAALTSLFSSQNA